MGADSGPAAPRQQQQQPSFSLLLVQHAILRELNERASSGSSESADRLSMEEPWHCGGLQELGACSSLCCSLEAVELSLQCAGQVALLLPPCAWLPLVAIHLGLQGETSLYISKKEAALAAAGAERTGEEDKCESAEKRFVHQFPEAYRSIVQSIGLRGTAARRLKQPVLAANVEISAAATGNLCTSGARKQALLLLARLLRGLQYGGHELAAGQLDLQQHTQRGADVREIYKLGEHEVWLLVRIIEHAQAGGSARAWPTVAAAVTEDGDELRPYVAAPLLQLLLAAGDLCRVEAKRLFAAALLQQVDPRSHPDIAKATVGRDSLKREILQLSSSSVFLDLAAKRYFNAL